MISPPEQPNSVAIDTACANCGYNLRGLPRDGNCPECAFSIRTSLGGPMLKHFPHARLRQLTAAFWLLRHALIVVALGPPILLFGMLVYRRTGPPDGIWNWFLLPVMAAVSIALVLCPIAALLAVGVPGRLEPIGDGQRWARIVRIAAGAGAVGTLVVILAGPPTAAGGINAHVAISGALLAMASLVAGVHAFIMHARRLLVCGGQRRSSSADAAGAVLFLTAISLAACAAGMLQWSVIGGRPPLLMQVSLTIAPMILLVLAFVVSLLCGQVTSVLRVAVCSSAAETPAAR